MAPDQGVACTLNVMDLDAVTQLAISPEINGNSDRQDAGLPPSLLLGSNALPRMYRRCYELMPPTGQIQLRW